MVNYFLKIVAHCVQRNTSRADFLQIWLFFPDLPIPCKIRFNPHITQSLPLLWHSNKDTVWLSSNRRDFMKMLNIQSGLNCSSCVKPREKKPVKELVRLPQHLPSLLLPLTETCPSSRSYSRKKKAALDIREPTWHHSHSVFRSCLGAHVLVLLDIKNLTEQEGHSSTMKCVTKQDCLIVLSKQRKNKVAKQTAK